MLIAPLLIASVGGFAAESVARREAAAVGSMALSASSLSGSVQDRVEPASGPARPSLTSVAGDPYATIKLIPVSSVPLAIAYDSGKHELFVANSNADNVSVISDATGTVVATITVGSGPSGVAYDSAKGEVFVTVGNLDGVSVISDSTNAVITTIPVGSAPSGIAYDSARGELYAANALDGTVSVISDMSNTVVTTVKVGTEPTAVAYDPGLGEVLVANFGSNNVSRIDDATHGVAASVNVGLAPIDLAYDPVTAETYVANFNGSSVIVIPDTVGGPLITIGVGTHPFGVAYGAGWVFVSNADASTESVIADSNHTIVANVSGYVGTSPGALVFDSHNGGWYVTLDNVDSVAVIAPGYAVTFIETGLPTSRMWIMDLNGTNAFGPLNTSSAATTSVIKMVVPNGTYAFSVRSVPGYLATPASGSLTVSGSALSRSITFVFPYAVTFTETGLPSGTSWSVTLAGSTKSSTTSSIAFQEGNGTYAFTAGAVSGFSATPSGGNVTVNGAAASQALAFTVSSAGPAGGLDLGLIAIILVVVVAAAVGGLLYLRMRRRKTPPTPGVPPEPPGTPPQP